MKQSQWIVAAFVMAGLIFVVTFAMNYLGGSRAHVTDPTIRPTRELVFSDVTPQDPLPFGVIEGEDRTTGHVDFWFHNPNDAAVEVGLQRKSCKCGSVEVFVLPEDRRPWVVGTAAAAWGTAPAGVLGAIGLCSAAVDHIQRGVEGHELLEKTEKTSVPPGALGWTRVGWSDRQGKVTLEATLWYDDPAGKTGTLTVALFFHEPIRVRRISSVGTLTEAALEEGVHKSIIVWSSTRDSLRLEAEADKRRDSPENDPFVVGKAVPLTNAEIHDLLRANNEAKTSTSEDTRGSIRCAYRIPILLQAVAPDRKTPFDVGPFNRRVNISSPDVNGDPRVVLVTGRVLGIIDIGDGNAGRIDFHDFSSGRGTEASVNLDARKEKVELAFDRERTAKFLDAEIVPVKQPPPGVLQEWTLKAKVLPSKAVGEFPRPNDPFYEDSAIYLKVTSPGKAPRSIRIPTTGRATGR